MFSISFQVQLLAHLSQTVLHHRQKFWAHARRKLTQPSHDQFHLLMSPPCLPSLVVPLLSPHIILGSKIRLALRSFSISASLCYQHWIPYLVYCKRSENLYLALTTFYFPLNAMPYAAPNLSSYRLIRAQNSVPYFRWVDATPWIWLFLQIILWYFSIIKCHMSRPRDSLHWVTAYYCALLWTHSVAN